uniref:G-protein coupled receptors family 1 profile domain-containing protein n=1 Tax=Equus caballus TaxID=9796 RepID=A0A3Q2HYS3_HORSE
MQLKEMENQTVVTAFIFLGFSNHLELQGLVISLVFWIIYLITLLGNAFILTVIRVNPALHTPIYYFLHNFSFLDICYSSTTILVTLVKFFQEKKTISYERPISQIFFVGVLLSAVTYDCYVAICHLLQYLPLVSLMVCVYLLTGIWLCGLENSVTHTVLAATLTLCGPNQTRHFLCDIPFFLELSCSDTFLKQSVLHVASAAIGLSPCLFTVVSYTLNISAILRIPSAQDRSNAFSSCASHLSMVVVFFGMTSFNYDRPREGYNLDMDILVPVLRNKETQGALRNLAGEGGLSRNISE